jgi:hypothetical protein
MADRFSQTSWLAQVAIEGTLVSLEGFVRGGEVHPLGLSVRTRIGLTETQNLFPRPQSFPEQVELRVIDIQRDFVRRAGFRQGYFHSEYLVGDDGRPFLTDPNLGRIGGAGVFHQLCYSFGISPSRLLAHMIEITLFGGELADDADLYRQPPQRSKCIIYGLAQPAVFQDVVAPPSPAVMHSVLAKKGVFMAAHGRNNRSHLGTVSGLEDDVDAFTRDLEIVTDHGNVPPLF